MKVFVSSTARDLAEERASAIAVLDRMGEAVAMEKFFASDHRPREECLARLRRCDAVVLILGFAYGSLDLETERSITELEYRTAKELDLPVFVFLKKNEDGRWASAERDPERHAKHEAFKALAESEATRRDFRAAMDLEREIPLAIRDYEHRHGVIGAHTPAFQTPEQFFRPYQDSNTIFNHAFPLVGRDQTVAQLTSFPSLDARVTVLAGRGGIGKTRILREAVERIQRSDDAPAVRFLREGVVFRREDASQLPAGHVLVVVDDAHRAEGLGELLAVVQAHPDRIKLVLSSRPYGVPLLWRRLVEAGFSQDAVLELPEVGSLGRPEVEALAREVLGPGYARYADRLVEVSRDSPLVTVVGGRLLTDQQVAPELLAGSTAFERAVFTRFQDLLVGEVANHFDVDPERARSVLRLVAALAPFRPAHNALVDRAADFSGIAPHQFREVLSALEAAGGLLRRGRSLRIAPDVLSDRVLAEACLDGQGDPTGYADTLFDRFVDLSLESLLRNLAELDWRAGNGDESLLLAGIWDRLRGRYDKAEGYARSGVVKAVARSAYFQPRHALEFVRHVWERLECVEEGEDGDSSIYLSPRGSVVRVLPDILEDAARYPETIRECLDLLWEMRSAVGQHTQSNPDHPIRVLQRIAEVQPLRVKPARVYEAVLDRAEVWLGRPDAFDHGFSPLDVLDSMLERSGSVTSAEGTAVTWQDFQVTSIGHGQFRRRALKLLETVTVLDDPRVQRRSLESLVAAFWRPRELGVDTAPGADELQSRRAENSEIARIIDDLLEKAGSPVLYAMAAHELSQVVFRAKPDSQDDVQVLLARVPQDYPVRLTSWLWRGPMQRPIRLGNEEASEEQLDAELREITRELLRRNTDPSAVHAEVERIFADLGRFGLAPDQTGYVLRALAEEDPAFATRLVERLITEQPESVLAGFLAALLHPLRSGPPEEFLRLLHLAASSPAVVPPRALAFLLSTGSRLSDEERAVIWQMAYHPDPVVRRFVLEALGRFPSDTDEEWDVLSAIDIAADPDLADRLCGCLVADEEAEMRNAPESVIQAVLAKLLDVPDLSHGEARWGELGRLHRFLDRLAARNPEGVAAFFLARLERYRRQPGSNGRYDPVPFTQFSSYSTVEADVDSRRRALRRVRDAALVEDLDTYWLAHVFVALSGGLDEVSLGVLHEWVESGDSEKLAAAVNLLQPVDGTFVLDQEDFVVGLLRQADRLGPQTLRKVRESLGSIALGNHGSSGAPDETIPFEVKVRERATAARARYPAGSVAEAFYGELERRAAEWIEAEQLDWEEEWARSFQGTRGW